MIRRRSNRFAARATRSSSTGAASAFASSLWRISSSSRVCVLSVAMSLSLGEREAEDRRQPEGAGGERGRLAVPGALGLVGVLVLVRHAAHEPLQLLDRLGGG